MPEPAKKKNPNARTKTKGGTVENVQPVQIPKPPMRTPRKPLTPEQAWAKTRAKLRRDPIGYTSRLPRILEKRKEEEAAVRSSGSRTRSK